MQITGHFSVGQNRVNNESVRNDGAEDHCENIHQKHAGKIEHVELQRAHTQLHMPAQHIEKVQEDQLQKAVPGLGENIGHQPPYLTLKDLGFIKAQQFVKHAAAVDHGHQNDNGIAQGNVQHQIGDTLITVAQAEPVESGAKIFHHVPPQ